MKLEDIKVKTPTVILKAKKEEEKTPEEIKEKSIVGFPANTDGLIDKHEGKTLIKKSAKSAKLSEKDSIDETSDKSCVGFTAKTNGISGKKEGKTLIKRYAKTAKMSEKE